jgi:hypothetical protein
MSVSDFFSAWGVRVLKFELLFSLPVFSSAYAFYRWRIAAKASRPK